MSEFQYRSRFKSTLGEVDTQVTKLLSSLDDRVKSYNRFGLNLVLRESLNNAVLHGNNSDQDKIVQFSIVTEKDQFIIEVQDEGVGFDWQSVVNTETDLASDKGRGFLILHIYCNKIEFNPAGNQITLQLAQAKKHN